MRFGWRRRSIFLRACLVGCICLLGAAGSVRADGPVVINEVMASNVTFLADPQGEFDDWIELYNTGNAPVDVGGLYLTDDDSEPRKWQIPADSPALTTIPAEGFLLIWADSDTEDPGLHADFGLSADGDEVALFASDGATLLDRVSFGPQLCDFSYGRDPDGGADLKLMILPTPGEANVGVSADAVSTPQFSHQRGFYEEAFTLELTTSTEDATIYYTLDGKGPLDSTIRGMAGTKYTDPIRITGTTCVRAAAMKTGWLSSASVTHSYIFLDQVIRQSSVPTGFPASWGGRAADYAMDQRVVADPLYRDEIVDDLKSTPSVSIAISNTEFFDSGGIYANPTLTGDQSERAASMEWIDPATGEHFGVNAGLRIHGGPYSRSQNPKNAFRLNFRARYGPSKLEFPLFPDTEVESFNSLALRSIWNYSWSGHCGMSGPANADYLRDAFARDTVRDMDRLTPYGRAVQVYINGLYWGLYIMTERPNESFAADHLGGNEDDYEILEAPSGMGASTTMDIVAGDEQVRTAWTALFTAANGNLTSMQAYDAIQTQIDVPTMTDYMLMIYYTGSRDAPVFLGDSYTPRNFYAIRQRDRASPFILVPWDTEWALEEPSVNRVNVVGVVNPHYLMDRLAANADFRMLLADRIYEQFYNDGALTKE
ncbi:MAG: CotH kinase family protein, partial [Phycisphaerales bacterium]